jgi:hypothetical protein
MPMWLLGDVSLGAMRGDADSRIRDRLQVLGCADPRQQQAGDPGPFRGRYRRMDQLHLVGA